MKHRCSNETIILLLMIRLIRLTGKSTKENADVKSEYVRLL